MRGRATTVRCGYCAKSHSLTESTRIVNRYRERADAGLCVGCGGSRDNVTKLCTPCRENGTPD
jgi:hypothetical protein